MNKFLNDSACIAQREYVNIPAWHKARYAGKGAVVLVDDISGSHSDGVAEVIKGIAPDAEVIQGSIGYIVKSNMVSACTVTVNGKTSTFDDFVRVNKVRYINCSKTYGAVNPDNPKAVFLLDRMQKYNLIVTGSAGNTVDGPIDNPYYGAAMMISSSQLKNGKPEPLRCAIGEGIDFTMFTGYQSGTSFAAPFVLGMCILIGCKYPGISQAEIYQYLMDHCQNMRDPGKDIYTGWGLPILGDPQEDWKGDSMAKEIILQVGSTAMKVDGQKIDLDQPPIFLPASNRVVVPVRAIAEAFGATVDWDPKTEVITITR